MDERTGRTDEPHRQERDRQALPRRQPQPVAPAPARLHRRLQLRPQAQDAQPARAIRVHLQTIGLRAKSIHHRSNPSKVGTEQTGACQSGIGVDVFGVYRAGIHSALLHPEQASQRTVDTVAATTCMTPLADRGALLSVPTLSIGDGVNGQHFWRQNLWSKRNRSF